MIDKAPCSTAKQEILSDDNHNKVLKDNMGNLKVYTKQNLLVLHFLYLLWISFMHVFLELLPHHGN